MSAQCINRTGRSEGGAHWRHIPGRIGIRLSALVVFTGFIASASAAQNYTVTPVGSNPGGINAAGQVAAGSQLWSPIQPNGTTGSFITLQPLPPPAGWSAYSYATSVNASGTVAGYTVFTKVEKKPPFNVKSASTATVWQNGQPVALQSNGMDSYAYGINGAGDIVGVIKNAATLWRHGSPTSLGGSSANGINDAGQIVGTKAGHATLWQNGKAYDLGTLLGSTGSSNAISINNFGVIVGSATALDAGGAQVTDAFVWTPKTPNAVKGTMLDISTLPSVGAIVALGVNSGGQVVGWFFPEGMGQHAFLWDAGHGMRDLNTLMPAGFTSVIRYGAGINDSGQILGAADYGAAFLLTP